jgi:hypothetical protein
MNSSLGEMIHVGCQRPGDPVEIWLARQRRHVPGFAVGIGKGLIGAGGDSPDTARITDAIPDAADRR